MSELEGAQFSVVGVKKGKRNKQPAPPFITSTLQQEAARKLGFTGQRTMRVAQQLYEGVDIPSMGTIGLITYMRTDSLRISEEARAAAKSYIKSRWGRQLPAAERKEFLNRSPVRRTLTRQFVRQQLTFHQTRLQTRLLPTSLNFIGLFGRVS